MSDGKDRVLSLQEFFRARQGFLRRTRFRASRFSVIRRRVWASSSRAAEVVAR